MMQMNLFARKNIVLYTRWSRFIRGIKIKSFCKKRKWIYILSEEILKALVFKWEKEIKDYFIYVYYTFFVLFIIEGLKKNFLDLNFGVNWTWLNYLQLWDSWEYIEKRKRKFGSQVLVMLGKKKIGDTFSFFIFRVT